MFALNVTFVFVIVSVFIGPTYSAHCNEHLTSNNLQLIADYASWRNIKYLLVLEIWTTCDTQILKSAVQHFSDSNKFLSFHSVTSNHLKNAGNLPTSNVGVVAFVNKHNHHLLHQFNDEVFSTVDLSSDYVAWLMITNEMDVILDELGFMTLSLVSDLVIAVRINYSRGKVAKSNETDKERELLPRNFPTEKKRSFFENVCENSNFTTMENYCLLQIYQIRKGLNTSLVSYTLGPWNFFEGTSDLARFRPVELRLNFQSYPLKFGRKNSSVTIPMTAQENGIEDDGNEENLSEISEYFKMFLNAGEENVYFRKLGYKDVNGKWSDLLGAVVNEDVDVAIDTVIKTPERLTDMTFTHTIMTSMRNIYIKPQKSNELRDIFLIPFEARLFLCILFIFIFIVISALFISKTNPNKYETNKEQPIKKPYSMRWDDAIIWTVGIFTMQGSCWKPKAISGKLILFFSLLFSLIIYNAYSAYITSILSVQLTNIRSLEDLLDSDYHIGYAKGSQDEIYLRSMNNTQLQQIYLRGYLQNTVNSVTEGLLKSAKGHYGFFASSSVARKELQNINNYKCNDDIVEMPLHMTRNTIAFPLSRKSPYKKIINLSIMKMYETGIYRYIHSSIVPDLLKCKKNSKKFSGAHLTDLTTAFGVIFIGSIIAIICIIAECFWFKKTNINAFLHKGLHFHHGLHPHFWHHHHHHNHHNHHNHHDHHIPNPNCKCKH